MARSNVQPMPATETETQQEVPPIGFDLDNLPDNAIYMSVDGYLGFLPMVNYDHLSPAENVAINEGRKQIALRKAQTVARNAEKSGQDVRTAVQNFLSSFQPDAETEFQTVANKRAEIAEQLLRARVPNANDATIAKNLPAFMAHEKHSQSIAAELAKWAGTRLPVKKRGSGKSGAEDGDTLDLDSLDTE